MNDLGPIDRYFGDYYLQHNARLCNGLVELKAYKSVNAAGATTQIVRCIGDRDLVFSQFRVSGLLPQDVVFFDIYRTESGKIVEHWDAFQETEGPNSAGRTIFDGPVKIERPKLTEATHEVVTGLVSRVFVMEEFDVLDRYVAPDVRQYTPGLGDLIDSLRNGFLQAQWFTGAIQYHTLRRVIAEGDFAVTCSQGEIGGVPYGRITIFIPHPPTGAVKLILPLLLPSFRPRLLNRAVGTVCIQLVSGRATIQYCVQKHLAYWIIARLQKGLAWATSTLCPAISIPTCHRVENFISSRD